MVLGFLGTLIALERAVALGEAWAYLAPAAAGAGGLAIVAGAPGDAGEVLIGCELSRMTGTSRRGRLLFACAAGLFGAGLLASLAAGPSPAGEAVPPGIRVIGAGLIALALWPARGR